MAPSAGGGVRPPDELLGREDAEVTDRACPATPRLLPLHLAVDGADQIVGGRIDLAGRVELVADGTPGPEREHLEALELQGLLVLERVEVAPGGVELPGHPETSDVERPRVAHRQREVEVAPAAAGQGLQLEMGVGAGRGALVGPDVAAVVEDAALPVPRPDEACQVGAGTRSSRRRRTAGAPWRSTGRGPWPPSPPGSAGTSSPAPSRCRGRDRPRAPARTAPRGGPRGNRRRASSSRAGGRSRARRAASPAGRPSRSRRASPVRGRP